MVTPDGRYRAAKISLCTPRTQCYFIVGQTQAPRKRTTVPEVTHSGNAYPKEDCRKGIDQVDLSPHGHLLPLGIARDDKEGDKQACRGI